MKHRGRPVAYALAAALCYGISAPVAKILLAELPPTLMAALLYLGAGFGMLLVNALRGKKTREREARITRRELPFIVAMVLLDITAPILLMLGLARTTSATASLLNNFEIVATTVIALVIFREAVGRRMWAAIGFIVFASVILSVEDIGSMSFSTGAVFVLLASVCWGFENNCTRMLSLKNPLQIVMIKGFGSGGGALIISLVMREGGARIGIIAAALLLGFVAYGLSIYCYILAQRQLGAARTSAYYAFAPFIGVGLSFIAFREPPTIAFIVALAIMAAGAYLAAFEKHGHAHVHELLKHEHRHRHDDGHHVHRHNAEVDGEHSHEHTHEEAAHTHPHMPDLHHRHAH